MKARIVLAVSEQISEYEYERHYKTIDVEVLAPCNENELKKCDILGGQWLQSESGEANMSDDLISRSSVLKIIEEIKCNDSIPKNYGTLLDILQAVRNLPTAYDVDKVVEQLKRNSSQFMDDPDDRDVDLRMAIRIVKAGGVNE